MWSMSWLPCGKAKLQTYGKSSAGRLNPFCFCWFLRRFSFCVFLTALGNIGIWATNYGYLPWPWSALIWYLWLPAAAAFARAPAFQLEVIRNARTAAGPFLSELLKSSQP